MDFSQRIKAIRLESGMNQTDFAQSIECNQSKYNKWENGKNAPDYDTLCVLSKKLNVTTDYLLGLSDYKNEGKKEEVDEFINLIKKTLASLDEPEAEQTKNCIKNMCKIWNRKDTTLLMTNNVMSVIYLIISVINEIMDTMSRARALSRCDVIEKEDFSQIMWAIRKVNRLELYIQQDVEQILENIVTVPSIKIKKALNNANYNVNFMDLLIDSFIVELGDIDNTLLLKEIDYIATQEQP